MEVPQSLFDAFVIFTQQEGNRNNCSLINNLRSGLRRHVLPDYGFTTTKLKKLDVVLIEVPIEQFRNVEESFEKSVKLSIDAGVLSLETVRGYRSAILRFLNWLREQGWYPKSPSKASKDPGKYAPPLGNGPNKKLFQYLGSSRQGKRCRSELHYSLKESELTPRLIRQLEVVPGGTVAGEPTLTKRDFSKALVQQFKGFPANSLPQYGLHYFLTAKEVPKRKDDPMREVTYQSRRTSILAFLGWLKNFRGWESKNLSLELMTDRELLEEFIAWGINKQDNTYAWAGSFAAAGLNVAKWLHHKYSRASFYKDVEAVVALRDYGRELDKKRRSQGTNVQEEKIEKFLTFEECEQVESYLKACCAPMREYFRKDGTRRCTSRRPERGVISSWQHYLIISLLIYCPVRQRELRELEVGVTIFREPERYWVRVGPDGHKVGSKTGRGREYPIPSHLTAYLDEWLTVWRPKFKADHEFVFMMVGSKRYPEACSKPFNAGALYKYVTSHMYKVTSFLFDEPKRTNPHFFRNIAITHQRKNGDPQQQEALAELMGHSVDEANRTYSLMTSREKTSKAQSWWDSTAKT
ncbi:site-specific integrase [Oculatella sp. FACHB-28]|uniref:site-specific integrase n=1 Tax=Oculatella sp. FACHB-28 TaxID=2692845 RepID=UPI001682CE20|nr:site-specific integrase [Oculatella sp. FACHB-28]MBD2054552.1 site-specific integrase [Oculatella sp. FACHB-28]